MFYLAHLGDGIGHLHQQRVSVAAGEDDVHHLRTPAQGLGHHGGVQHSVADGIVDLVQNDHIPVAGVYG